MISLSQAQKKFITIGLIISISQIKSWSIPLEAQEFPVSHNVWEDRKKNISHREDFLLYEYPDHTVKKPQNFMMLSRELHYLNSRRSPIGINDSERFHPILHPAIPDDQIPENMNPHHNFLNKDSLPMDYDPYKKSLDRRIEPLHKVDFTDLLHLEHLKEVMNEHLSDITINEHQKPRLELLEQYTKNMSHFEAENIFKELIKSKKIEFNKNSRTLNIDANIIDLLETDQRVDKMETIMATDSGGEKTSEVSLKSYPVKD
jgi:protein-tyrosine phosphatase